MDIERMPRLHTCGREVTYVVIGDTDDAYPHFVHRAVDGRQYRCTTCPNCGGELTLETTTPLTLH